MPSCDGAMVIGPAPAQRIFEPHHRPLEQGAIVDIERARALDAEDRAELQVVLQILADAGKRMRPRGTPIAASTSGRPTPDSSSSCGEPIAPAASITSPRARASRLAPSRRIAHADRAPARRTGSARHERRSTTRRLGRLEHRLQKAGRRAPAPAAPLVDLEIVRALVVAAIEIVDLGDADLGAGVAHGVEDRPGDARALDPPFAARAVQVAGAAVVVLVAQEIGQHVVPAPAGETELAPAVVVGRLAAHVDHAVDRRASRR